LIKYWHVVVDGLFVQRGLMVGILDSSPLRLARNDIFFQFDKRLPMFLARPLN